MEAFSKQNVYSYVDHVQVYDQGPRRRIAPNVRGNAHGRRKITHGQQASYAVFCYLFCYSFCYSLCYSLC